MPNFLMLVGIILLQFYIIISDSMYPKDLTFETISCYVYIYINNAAYGTYI